MKIEHGKITEATEDELFAYYLNKDWDEVICFPDFLRACRRQGTVILEEEEADADHQ